MLHKFIRFEKIERVGVITLHRPEALNALNQDLLDELSQVLAKCEEDPDIHCMVLLGSEKAFAAGAGIKEMYTTSLRGGAVMQGWEKVGACKKPIIAAVSGYVLGGGCEIAMMCDMIFASETAVFGQPEVSLGTLPGAGGTQRLPRVIGKAKAMDVCLAGRFMDAREAERSGLASRVVPVERLKEEALQAAQKIASYSLPVILMVKEAISQAFEAPLSKGLAFEHQLFRSTFALEDQKEGMKAFLEKRAPEFKDK